MHGYRSAPIFFSLSPIQQCHSSLSESVQQHQCNSGQLTQLMHQKVRAYPRPDTSLFDFLASPNSFCVVQPQSTGVWVQVFSSARCFSLCFCHCSLTSDATVNELLGRDALFCVLNTYFQIRWETRTFIDADLYPQKYNFKLPWRNVLWEATLALLPWP